MKKYTGLFLITCIFMLTVGASSCQDTSSDAKQRDQQELLLEEATRQVGMPAITKFREKRLMKMILEKREQADLLTYTYVFIPMTGKFRFVGDTLGFPIPYATQFTNPQKIALVPNVGRFVIPQADPNALFSPASADGTWTMMREPGTDRFEPTYMEEKINTFLWKLPARMVTDD